MTINISSLQEYISLNPLLVQETMYRDLTIKQVAVQDVSGIVPGKFSNRYIKADAALGPCCRVPVGDTEVIERLSEAVCILSGDEYCETDLAQILSNAVSEAQRVRFTAGAENAGSVEQMIVDANRTSFVNKLEILSWIGDKTNANDDLNRTDGLITKAEEAGSGAISYTMTGTNAYWGLYQAIRQVPAEARLFGGNIGIFVPEEFAEAYYMAAVHLNLFHYPPGGFQYGANRPVIGYSGYEIIPTRGLNGTGKILITPIKNIVWFNSRREDHNTLDWDYDKYHQLYYWRVKTIFGVDLVRPEFAVVVTYDQSILDGDNGIPVSIVAPLGAGGGVLTETTA